MNDLIVALSWFIIGIINTVGIVLAVTVGMFIAIGIWLVILQIIDILTNKAITKALKSYKKRRIK